MIYLDHAATTPMAPEVLSAMLPWFQEDYGNPGGIYRSGVKARNAVNKAREEVAALLHAGADEIYFTAGGTEADNWAVKAVAEACEEKGRHIITTKIEHHAILHTCAYLEQRGFEVTYLDVDAEGLVQVEQVERAIRPDTVLISVMFANNEIGTIQPIAEIAALARKRRILFHTDAVQAAGQIPIDVERMQIDLLSFCSHKIYGPKGVGCLYIRKGVKLGALIHGGAQERSRRAGTENVPGIVGFGAAAALARRRLMEDEQGCTGENVQGSIRKICEMRDYLIRRFEEEIPDCHLNGHRDRRLPGNVNMTFEGVEGESLLIRLDLEEICASAGSACTSGSLDPSHVLLAIGLDPARARSSVRFTLGIGNTQEEMDQVVGAVKKNVARLREMKQKGI
ncbi:MAG: cysteine desulfurase NifS [Lachnospiraceae bacterium]|nr:cysteine desulfurase NifS [Lachnospiraceae bacterium]